MEHELDYSTDSLIDVNALDIEWVKHPELEERYIDQVARMKRAVIRATENMKLAHERVKNTRSKLIQYCHSHPEKCVGKKSATGPEAEAYYRTHPDYLVAKKRHIKAEIRLLEAEEERDTAVDMKDLMHFTRSKALEQLVILHNAGYFAGPNSPRDINREMRKWSPGRGTVKPSRLLSVQRN